MKSKEFSILFSQKDHLFWYASNTEKSGIEQCLAPAKQVEIAWRYVNQELIILPPAPTAVLTLQNQYMELS